MRIFFESIFEDLLSTLTKSDKDDYLSEYEEMKPIFFDGNIPELNFKLQVLLGHIWFALVGCRVFAKAGIELKLQQKELEVQSKYISNSGAAGSDTI